MRAFADLLAEGYVVQLRFGELLSTATVSALRIGPFRIRAAAPAARGIVADEANAIAPALVLRDLLQRARFLRRQVVGRRDHVAPALQHRLDLRGRLIGRGLGR